MNLRAFGIRKRRNEGRWLLAGMLMATTALVMTPKAEAQDASFEDLFDDAYRAEEVIGLSNDGSRAVVNGFVGNRREALLWDGDDLTSIGGLDRNVNARAMAISGDGNVIVGDSIDSYVRARAFRWSAADGMVDLGTLASGNIGNSIANDVDEAGRVIVGRARADDGLSLGFAWVMDATEGQSDDGQMFALVALSGGEGAEARGVSDDGRIAAGISVFDTGELSSRATAWDISDIRSGNGDPIELEGLGGPVSAANAVSGDGSVIVGSAETAMRYVRAVRWVGDGADGWAVEDLGVLYGAGDSYALATSKDGAVVGGYSKTFYSEEGENIAFAFRWDEDGGMVYLGDFLLEHGVDVGSLRLERLQSLSDDGSVMGGAMEDEDGKLRAFIARVAPPEPDPDPQPDPEPIPGNGIMDVEEYHRTLYAAAGIANAGEFLTWLPMNGAHHRPLMLTPSLDGDMCAWATGDFAHHGGSSTGLALAEMGACADLMGGDMRIGGALGTTGSWQDLPMGGSARMRGQYVLGEVDWQPDGTPLLLSVTGMLGGWSANIDRAYSNGADTAVSRGQTDAYGGVVRMRADWLDAAVVGNTSINPWASLGFGGLHVGGYRETGGPFPAVFSAQNLGHADMRVGVTAITEFSTQTTLSTTLEVAHRTGTAAAATGNVPGLFDFAVGGGTSSQTWLRVGAELDHKINDSLAFSTSMHLASDGRDPSIAASAGFKGAF